MRSKKILGKQMALHRPFLWSERTRGGDRGGGDSVALVVEGEGHSRFDPAALPFSKLDSPHAPHSTSAGSTPRQLQTSLRDWTSVRGLGVARSLLVRGPPFGWTKASMWPVAKH